MRIGTYEAGGRTVSGVIEGDGEAAVVRPLPEGVTVLDVLAQTPEQRAKLALGEPTPLSRVRLLAPHQPPTVRDFVGFEQHMQGMVMTEGPTATMPQAWYEAPAFYFSNATSIYATGDLIELPPLCERFDYELEVAAVIGTGARDLDLDTAESAIAAYMIYNDWSARDLQTFDRRLGMGWAKGKDTASTLGPWLVTADELERYRDAEGRLDLQMTVWRNGKEIGSDSLANAAWSFAQMLVYASRGTWLVPGDVVGSGTCGSGCLGELWGRRGKLDPPPLQPGDHVKMQVVGIGTIENTVVEPAAVASYGRPRRRAA
jgi:2-keto-4-pentenoate hydratase/2-oxohepta-3-ene-1,7-dioic acid hydratase in catechol pathway